MGARLTTAAKDAKAATRIEVIMSFFFLQK
jgi:hypothetical protein